MPFTVACVSRAYYREMTVSRVLRLLLRFPETVDEQWWIFLDPFGRLVPCARLARGDLTSDYTALRVSSLVALGHAPRIRLRAEMTGRGIGVEVRAGIEGPESYESRQEQVADEDPDRAWMVDLVGRLRGRAWAAGSPSEAAPCKPRILPSLS